jgi:hypothetical protein
MVVNEADEAAGAVAAGACIGAIGIDDAVVKIGVVLAGRFDQQDLIAADTKAAVGETPAELRVEVDLLADSVDDYEVVASPVHFAEGEYHEIGLCAVARKSAEACLSGPFWPQADRVRHSRLIVMRIFQGFMG